MLTTLERLKSLLGSQAESWGDEMLLLQITAASISIENRCKRSFKKQRYTEKISGHASKYINLRNYPIHQVEFPSDWEFEILEEGRIYKRDGWPIGSHNIEVSYIGGYVLPSDATVDEPSTLPEPLEIACLLLSQQLLRDPSIRSERVGDISVAYADPFENGSMPQSVESLISAYVGRWV